MYGKITMAGLFDSHTHLTDEWMLEDIDGIISRIEESELEFVMNVGCDVQSSELAAEQAQKYDWCYASAGCHPHEVEEMDEGNLERIRELALRPKVMAIGEIGLDYYYENSPRELQQKWFRKQIRLAKEIGKPVIIHDREAHEDTMRILREEDAFSNGVLMHCYSGSAEMAKQYIKLGAMLSIPGTITYKNNRRQKEVVETIPLKYLMIETDAPYLTPVPFRGKRNEPSYVKYTAEKVAEIAGTDYETVVKITNENARRFFGI